MQMNTEKGITLIELIIVVSIVGILAIALAFSFEGWMGKYRVEVQAKTIYTDLMSARARAMNRNRMHFVNFPDTTSYEVYEDTSDADGDPVIDGDGLLQEDDDTLLPTYPKTLEYAVTIGTVGPPQTVRFNNRGRMVSAGVSICIFTDFDNDDSHLSDFDPDYDCIVLAETRIELGKVRKQNTEGGVCNASNCQIK